MNLESYTLRNRYYRRVVYTTTQLQLVVMNLLPHEEIGIETHKNTTQFIYVESGSGYAIIRKKKFPLKNGSAVIIPSKTKHNIIAGRKGMQLYTLYSPPEHSRNKKQLVK